MARRGRSSRGRSSGGRSKSRSRSRSTSRSRSSGRKSSARSTRSSSSGRTARKSATSRPRRTTRTVSPKARRATQRTAKETPRTVRRTAITRTVSPVKNRRLTGIGRINLKPTRYNPLIHKSPRGKLDAQGRIMGGFLSPQSQTSLQNRQLQFSQTMTRGFTAGGTNTVNVKYPNGQTRRMNLSVAAIQSYQKAGLKVTPVSFTMSGGQRFPTPAIPRINNPSKAWTDPQNQNQLHVTQQMKVKPNTRTNSNFGGLGANPWNPVQALQGLFNVSPQQQPEKQWLPQRNENIINPDRPTYTAMTTGLQEAAAYQETPQGFQSQLMGTGAHNPTDISAGDRIKDLFKNQYVLYGGLAVAGIVVLKLILGGGKQVVYR